MKERRKHPRLKISTPLNLYPRNSIILKGIGKLNDISMGGMNVESDKALKNGTKVFLEGEMPVEFIGRVIRKEKKDDSSKYGVKFDKVNYLRRLKVKYMMVNSEKYKE